MVAQPSGTAEVIAPFSPAHPAPDPDHERRTAIAIERALRQIPFYLKRGHAVSTPAARDRSLADTLRSLPLLFKKDIRATLPKQWVPAERDAKAELASGALELVETSGSTGDRLRILWDKGWWLRQESAACGRTRSSRARHGRCPRRLQGGDPDDARVRARHCHVGDLPFEERIDESRLFPQHAPDPRSGRPRT
jgi:hypothetical protein